MNKTILGYLDALINRKYHETKDLKYPVLDVRLKATQDIKAGEVIQVALYQSRKERVTGNVTYSGTIYRNEKEENN